MSQSSLYQVNFLPWRQQHLHKKKRAFIFIALIVTTLVVTSVSLAVVTQTDQWRKVEIVHHYSLLQQQQLQQLKEQIIAKQKQLQTLINRQNIIKHYTQRNQLLLDVLHALPSIVPPQSWLNAFSLLDDQLDIKANSYHFHDVSDLSHRLTRSHLVSDVQLKKFTRSHQLNYLHFHAKPLHTKQQDIKDE